MVSEHSLTTLPFVCSVCCNFFESFVCLLFVHFQGTMVPCVPLEVFFGYDAVNVVVVVSLSQMLVDCSSRLLMRSSDVSCCSSCPVFGAFGLLNR